MTRKGEKMVYPHNKEVLPGPETTYASLGARWANVANTPFRFWKAKSYEGGICTPMIAHWPKGIKKNVGKTTPEIGHVMDIMATCIDMAAPLIQPNIKETTSSHWKVRACFLSSRPDIARDMTILDLNTYNERAFLSNDGWKLVRPGENAQWELYNLNEDRSENIIWLLQYPEKVAEMSKAYEAWAKRCMVEPYPGQKKK